MRSIIIYYSFTGNTHKVAEILAGYLGQKGEVNTRRLKALDETNLFLRQAVRALLHKRAQINTMEFDLRDYDLICFGSPVWAFAPAPAMNTYLADCFGLEGKSVVLFATYGSGSGLTRYFRYMKEILSEKRPINFKQFSIQQLRVNNKEFVNKIIEGQLNQPTATSA